jgi:acyl carrier protein
MVQNTVLLEDAFVPDSAVLLAPGEGMEAAHDAMLFSRLGIGAICVGAMKRCAQLMARYASRRTISTGTLADNAVTVARLQDLTSAIHACESLVYAIAGQVDQGEQPAGEAYLACKAAASEALGHAADDLVQMLGGRGYIETNGAPQILRDARVLRILEGPTETLYAHLGATLAKPGGAAQHFIETVLQRPALATELAAAAARVATLADGAAMLFGSASAARQWTDYRLGELAASAFLLGAAEQRQLAAGADGHAASNAVVWARRRFHAQLQALLAELAGQRPYSRPSALLELVADYARSIGDIDQALPGEDQQPDALLRRAAAPRPVVAHKPAAAADVPGTGSAATRAIVHDCVLRWLRGERRDVAAVDVDTPFSTLGMDSLATASIAVDLEQRLGQTVVPEVLFDHQSVNELAGFLDRQRQQAALGAIQS